MFLNSKQCIILVSVWIILTCIYIYRDGSNCDDTSDYTSHHRSLKSSLFQEELLRSSEKSTSDTEPMKRARHLRQICEKLQDLGQVPIELERHSYQYMYVNDNFKFIFCMMPKLACTNWKRVFLALNEQFPNKDYVMNKMPSSEVHVLHAKYSKTLANYSPTQIQERLQTYKKLIFVRDPFERLLSAYKDKMFRNDSQFFLNIASNIIKLKRKDGNKTPGDVKFIEFVRYLTDPDTFQSSYQEHWAKYSHLSQPCLVRYDFIGKFETMDTDVTNAFKYMAIDENIHFPSRSVAYKSQKSSEVVEEYFNQIPEHYLQKLWQLFKNDFLLFSYPIPALLSGIAGI